MFLYSITIRVIKKLYKLLKKSIYTFDYLITNIVYEIYVKLDKKYGIHYLHIGDLLTPIDGKMTSVQYVTASRVMDIIISQGNRTEYTPIKDIKDSRFPWSVVFNKRESDDDSINQSNIYFDKFLHSCDKYGFNPAVGYVYATVNPLTFSGGTHRLAYLFLKNKNSYFPIKFSKFHQFYKVPMLPINGYQYVKTYLCDAEIKLLEKKYNEILSVVRTYLSGVIINPTDSVLKIIKEFGVVTDFNRKQLDNKVKKIFKKSKNTNKFSFFYSFHIQLYNQKLYYNNGMIKSYYIDEILYLTREINNYVYICPTVTDSISLDLLLDEVKVDD